MESVAFFLGVESVTKALSVCKTLDFVTEEGGELTTPARINISFIEVKGGAILVISGKFTKGEIRQIQALGKYDYEGVQEEKIEVITSVAKKVIQENVGARIHSLSKKDAEE